MAAKKHATKEDWFAKLEKELEKRKEEVIEEISTESEKKEEINRTLIEDFWKIWIKFNEINVHMTMVPEPSLWGVFEEFPYQWRFKGDFDVAKVNLISLTDTTRDQGRTGDSLKALYFHGEEGEKLRLIFEFCEGEKYYKYSGWKRIYSQYLLYEAKVKEVDLDKIHEVLLGVIATWYESHLKRKRDIILNYIRENFEKLETFTE
jgi:hypothetical protein